MKAGDVLLAAQTHSALGCSLLSLIHSMNVPQAPAPCQAMEWALGPGMSWTRYLTTQWPLPFGQ